MLTKSLFFFISCEFFVILDIPLANYLGKICYSFVILLEIINKFQSLDKRNHKYNEEVS